MPSEKCWYLCEGNAIHVLGAEETKFFCDLLPFQHCVTSLRGTAWSPQPLQIKPGLIFLLWAPLYVSKRNVQCRWFCNKGEDLEQPGTVKVTSSMSLPTQTLPASCDGSMAISQRMFSFSQSCPTCNPSSAPLTPSNCCRLGWKPPITGRHNQN